MPLAGFEPKIPVFKRAKTLHALDRAATVTGSFPIYYSLIMVPSDLYSLKYLHRRSKLRTTFAPVNTPYVLTPVLHGEWVVSFISLPMGSSVPTTLGGHRMLSRLAASRICKHCSARHLATALFEIWSWNGLTTALHSSARDWTRSLRYTQGARSFNRGSPTVSNSIVQLIYYNRNDDAIKPRTLNKGIPRLHKKWKLISADAIFTYLA
jgi:hypothetical protein